MMLYSVHGVAHAEMRVTLEEVQEFPERLLNADCSAATLHRLTDYFRPGIGVRSI